MQQLRDLEPDGLSIRLTPIARFHGRTFKCRVLGVLGPWWRREPKQFVACGRLITPRPAGQLPFPVASCLVDASRAKLVLDLSNLPLSPSLPPTAPFIQGLAVGILQNEAEGEGVLETLDPRPDLTAEEWLRTSGVFEWDLNSSQLQCSWTIAFASRLVSSTNPWSWKSIRRGDTSTWIAAASGSTPANQRPLTFMPGGLASPCRAWWSTSTSTSRKRSLPSSRSCNRPVSRGSRGCSDIPRIPSRMINSEPRYVLFDRPGPLQVTTDADGFG